MKPPTNPATVPEEIKAWADDAIANQRWFLHLAAARVGRIRKFYDGVELRYVSAVTGAECNGPVVELESGNSFTADPSNFMELKPEEVAFFVAFSEGLGGLFVASVQGAAAAGLKAPAGMRLMAAAIRAQLAALEAGR